MDKDKMLRVSKNAPCPICGKPDWCLVAEDGSAAICSRVETGSKKQCGEAGWLHVLSDKHRNTLQNLTFSTRISNDFGTETDCSSTAKLYQSQLTENSLHQLASQLNISAANLIKLSIGWDGQAHTFPMSNDFGKIIGIHRRFLDGIKASMTGSQTGLFIPAELPSEGSLLICEGLTDTAAALDLGFAAIGRPNCNSKVDMVAEFCKGRSEIIIISDNDNAGKKGAEKLAGELLLHCPNVKVIYPPDDVKDLRQWLNSGLTAERLKEVIGKSDVFNITVEPEGEWELPASLGHFNLPTFPLEAFPSELGVLCGFCEAVAESYQVPIDLPAMLVLSVGGASLAKKISIHVRGDHWEPVNLFTVVALPPANRKSGVFSVIMEPLSDFEKQENERLAPLIGQNLNQRKILEESLKYARSQAAKAKKPEDRERYKNQTSEFTDELNAMEVLKNPQYIGDDATPESIAILLNDNDGRFALLSPEGDVFDLMAGRYSSTDTPNLGVYLKGHAGDDIRVNRANRDFPAKFIERPALSIGVTVQPEVLRGLTGKKGFRGRGLLGRFLYSLPQSLLGHRKINPSPMDSAIVSAYKDHILNALRLEPNMDPEGKPYPHIVTVSSDALQELDRFAMQVEKHLGPGGDFASMGDWAGKLVGAVCRIAGIFHGLIYAMSGNPAKAQINTETMLGAIAIGEYLIPHAKAAFFEMGADSTIDLARKILAWVSSGQQSEFTRREAFNSLRGSIEKVDELDQPLEILINHGYIREVLCEHKGPGRKPSQKYKINPLWLTQNTQNAQNYYGNDNSADFAQFAQEVTL